MPEPRRTHPSWQRRREAVLQYIVSNPAARNRKIAGATGYSEWQISRIINSPEFRCRYSQAMAIAPSRAFLARIGRIVPCST
jgi:hypothetical protein